MISIWGECMVTGCTNSDLLIGSHAKPWKDSDDEERIDPFNGFLLTPNLDKLFDRGFISFSDDGDIMISDHLSEDDIRVMGLRYDMSVKLSERHRPYLEYHRTQKYKWQ
jgi:predicted restriction endonuclease